MVRSAIRLIRTALALAIVLISIGFARAAHASVTGGSSSSRNDIPSTSGHNVGLGLMLGEPTGVDLKYWLSNANALHFGFAYSFNDYTELMGSYLWEFPRAFGARAHNQFVPYVGIGGAFFFNSPDHHYYSDNSAAFGARIPLGIEFLPQGAPVGITAELAPGVGLIPSTFGFFQGYIGARFYL